MPTTLCATSLGGTYLIAALSQCVCTAPFVAGGRCCSVLQPDSSSFA